MTDIVSDVTASLGSRCNKSGPWYYNGAVYVVLRESPGIGIYKCAYTESGGFSGSFTAQDTANEPGGNVITSSDGHFSVQDPNSPNLIHVVNYGVVAAGTKAVEYSRFNCSTDTWAETDTVAVSTFTLGAGNGSAMIVIRSDGDKIIIYQGPAEKLMGTNYGRIFYTVHQGTAWGDASGAVDAGGSVSYQSPTIAIDDADTTHIAFENGSAWRYQTLNSSNNLGTEQAMGGNAQLWVFPQLRYYNNAGTHEIYFSFRHTSGGAYYIPIVSGTPGTQVQMTATNQYSQGATWETTHDMCIRLSNGHKYLAFAQQTNQDDYYVTNASGSWSSDTVVSGTGQTIQDLDAEIIVTDESATVLAVVFQDSAGAQMEIWTITIEAATGDQTITIGSTIASGESVYSPTLTISVEGAGNIASGETVYSPQINLNVDAGTVTSGEVVYSPQLDLTLIAGTVASGEVVYAPGSIGEQTISDAGNIASGEQVYAPHLDLTIDVGTVTSSEQVYSPQINLTIDAGTVASGEQVYAPQVNLKVDAGTVASGEQVYAPQLNLNVDAGTVASGEQVYAPVVSLEGGDQTIANAGNIASGEVVYNPQLNLTISLSTVASGEVVYSPQLDLVIDAGTVASGEQVYVPQLNLTIDAGTVTSSESVYNPVVSLDSGDQTISDAGAVASGEIVYSPQLDLTIIAGTVASGETVYSPQVNLSIDAGTVATSEVVYSPQLDLIITLSAVASGEVVYAPTISGAGVLQIITITSTIASGEVVYALAAEQGPILGRGNPAYENERITFWHQDDSVVTFDRQSERLVSFRRVRRG